jgi:hypothetical protein
MRYFSTFTSIFIYFSISPTALYNRQLHIMVIIFTYKIHIDLGIISEQYRYWLISLRQLHCNRYISSLSHSSLFLTSHYLRFVKSVFLKIASNKSNIQKEMLRYSTLKLKWELNFLLCLINYAPHHEQIWGMAI